MQAILIWFDYLPYGVPGCCGNTEAHTLGFDHFASVSVTFDNCFVDERRGESATGLVETLLKLHGAGASVRVLSVHPTQLVSLLSQQSDAHACSAIDVEMLDDEGQLSERMIRAVADAPADGDEQRVVTVVSLPGVVTAEGNVLEHLLESADRLLDRLAFASTRERTLLLATAGAGEVSAEPGREMDERLIHVPLLGRSGPPLKFGLHSPSLVGQGDVLQALLRWAGLRVEGATRESATHAESLLRELSGERVGSRQSLLLRGPDGAVGVRTRQWYLTTRLEGTAGTDATARAVDQAALYAKPGDLWDRLDVASQSPGVVEELAGMLPVGEGKSGDGP